MKALLVALVFAVLAESARPGSVKQYGPETLRAALAQAGYPIPNELAAKDLDRPWGNSRFNYDAANFVAAIYFPDESPGDYTLGPLHLIRVSKTGRVDRLRFPGDEVIRGTVLGVSVTPRYTLLRTHTSPSAGYVVVFDASFAFVTSLYGFGAEVAADGSIIFEGSMVHFADEHHQTLGAFNPITKQTIELFPGTFKSPYGALVEQRIKDTLARLERERGVALADGEKITGFDRYIETKKIAPNGRVVAFTVWYGNLKMAILHPGLELDSGLQDPSRPEYNFTTIARCARNDTDVWTCRERLLDDAAKSYRITLRTDPPLSRDLSIEEILEREIAGR